MSDLPKESGVVIIGAGIAGCSLAEYLRNPNKETIDTIVVESEPSVGRKATSQSAARIRTSMWTSRQDILLIKHTMELYDDFTKRMSVQDYQAHSGFKRYGYLWLADNQDRIKSFRASIELQKKAGIKNSVILTPNEVHKLNPNIDTTKIVKALLSPGDGRVLPEEITHGLYKKAKYNGAEFYFNQEITAIDVENGTVVGVRNANDEYVKTKKVVIAAGAYSAEIGKNVSIDGTVSDIKVPITPIKRQLTHLIRPEGYKFKGDHPFTLYKKRYFDLEAECMMLGYAHPKDKAWVDNNGKIRNPIYEQSYFAELLAPKIVEICPILAEAEFDPMMGGSAGLYAVSKDQRALICEHPEIKGLYFLTGFSGHGLMQVPTAAELLGNMILGKPTQINGIEIEMACFQYEKKIIGQGAGNI